VHVCHVTCTFVTSRARLSRHVHVCHVTCTFVTSRARLPRHVYVCHVTCTFVASRVRLSRHAYVCHVTCTFVASRGRLSRHVHVCHVTRTFVTSRVRLSRHVHVCHVTCTFVTSRARWSRHVHVGLVTRTFVKKKKTYVGYEIYIYIFLYVYIYNRKNTYICLQSFQFNYSFFMIVGIVPSEWNCTRVLWAEYLTMISLTLDSDRVHLVLFIMSALMMINSPGTKPPLLRVTTTLSGSLLQHQQYNVLSFSLCCGSCKKIREQKACFIKLLKHLQKNQCQDLAFQHTQQQVKRRCRFRVLFIVVDIMKLKMIVN
jgi:hypothetical protein